MLNKLIAFLAFTPCAFALAATAPQTEPQIKDNPQITAVLSEISAKNIEATIRKLVSFGTRHTLSDAQSETRGIGAARKWLHSEVARYTRASGGGLRVAME